MHGRMSHNLWQLRTYLQQRQLYNDHTRAKLKCTVFCKCSGECYDQYICHVFADLSALFEVSFYEVRNNILLNVECWANIIPTLGQNLVSAGVNTILVLGYRLRDAGGKGATVQPPGGGGGIIEINILKPEF